MSDRIIAENSPWRRRIANPRSGLLAWLGRFLRGANDHIANGIPKDKFSWTIFM